MAIYKSVSQVASMEEYPFTRQAIYYMVLNNKEFAERCVRRLPTKGKIKNSKILINVEEFAKYIEDSK